MSMFSKICNRKRVMIGSFVICLLLSLYAIYYKTEPQNYQETVNASTYLHTEPLHKGDSVEQTVRSTYKGLSAIECAVSYDEKMAEQGKVLFEVFDEQQEVISSQELSLASCPNASFLKIALPKQEKVGKNFTIQITNTSSEDTEFSVLYTENPYRLLDNLNQYHFNDVEQQGQLISRYTYIIGYNVYPAVTWIIWIMLTWVVFFNIVKKK